MTWRLARELPRTASWKQTEWAVSFGSSVPDLRLFPFKEFRSHFVEHDHRAIYLSADYGNPRGDPLLLNALELYLRRLRGITGKAIVVTNGAQEGLYLIAQLLLRAGDAVAVERLGYPHAWHAFRAAGGKLVPLELDEHGADPDSLERLVRRRKIRMIYLTTLHQFPTTVTLPPDRRRRIYDIAADRGIPIVEDDYDHEFHYHRRPQAPMASDDPAELVVYVSTFSKVLFPAMRLGFLALPESLANDVVNYREIVNQRTGSLLQRALARFMSSGGFERHLRRVSHAYRIRRDTMIDSLEAGRRSGISLDYRVPDGGMAVWVETHQPSASLAKRAAARGIYVAGEELFSLDGIGSHLRLGFAGLDPDEIVSGMTSLFEVFHSNRV